LDDRLRDANNLKVKGNELYKQKHYEEAIKIYGESLSIAHPDVFANSSQELMYKMAELNVLLLQNMSTAYYALKQYATSEKVASQVLLINPRHFKALYRKALCLFEMNRLEEAYACIKDAYSIDATVGEVNDAYKKIHTAYKAEKEEKKQLYKSMFGNK
jgi:tetratricopeptide (TPR) repeat protein